MSKHIGNTLKDGVNDEKTLRCADEICLTGAAQLARQYLPSKEARGVFVGSTIITNMVMVG